MNTTNSAFAQSLKQAIVTKPTANLFDSWVTLSNEDKNKFIAKLQTLIHEQNPKSVNWPDSFVQLSAHEFTLKGPRGVKSIICSTFEFYQLASTLLFSRQRSHDDCVFESVSYKFNYIFETWFRSKDPFTGHDLYVQTRYGVSDSFYEKMNEAVKTVSVGE